VNCVRVERMSAVSPRVAVVGGGVAGLAAAVTLRRERPDLDVVVFERAPRAGGLVRSERTPDGWLIEHGPDAMVSTGGEVRALTGALALDAEVVTPASEAGGSRVLRGGRLHPLPMGVMMPGMGSVAPVLTSSLLSWRGRGRLLVEGFVPARREEADESVESFVVRRMGRDVFESLVRPLVQGIRGVDPAELSAAATLPQLVEMERRHGSIALGIVRSRTKSPPRHGRAQGHGHGTRGGLMASFRGGMGQLTGALAHALGSSLRHGLTVTRATPEAHGRWRLVLSDGASLDVDAVIFATPAHATARIFETLDADIAAELDAIRYAPAAHVALGYRTRDLGEAAEGTGFLVGETRRRALRACTWASRKFPGRAPDGATLARCSLALDGLTDASDEDLARAAMNELRELAGVSVEPVFERVVRIAKAMPRYEPGHHTRTAHVLERARAWPTVAFAGNAWNGAGVADCVASGVKAARQTAAQSGTGPKAGGHTPVRV
jgi:oxygen-dependent protoporphyrinogen oxidase